MEDGDPFIIILLGRVLQGIVSAGVAPVVILLVGNMFKDDKQVSAGLGLTETANKAGKVLSPIIGASLASTLCFFSF